MNYQNILIITVIAAIVMYLMRMVPLVFCKGKIKNKFLRSFLSYVPFAVLTSMTIPEAFNATPNVVASTVGIVVSVILAYFGQGLLTVSVSATAVAILVNQLANYIHF